MPQVNVTIDNINPLITYLPVGAWIEGDDVADKLGANYSNGGTFTLCTNKGSFASINFNGTSVWVFGAKRENHGPYSVELDGITSAYDGEQADPGLFQYPLFSATSLTQELHQLVITNLETDSVNHPFLDLDFITWTTGIGNDTETITSTVVQDTDLAAFSYSPASSWTTDTQNLSGFNGSTGHSTFSGDAYVSFTFSGDAVSLYGAVGPNASPYNVQLDGRGTSTFNATKQTYYSQVILYHADNLGPGRHTLKVVNKPSSFGQGLSIDYAVVATVPSVLSGGDSSGNSTSNGNGSSNSSHKKRTGAGAIAGIAVASIVVIAVLLFFFLFRHRKYRHRHAQPTKAIYPLADQFPTRPINDSTVGIMMTPLVSQSGSSAGTLSYSLQTPSHSTVDPFRSATSDPSPWGPDGTSSDSDRAVHKPPLHAHNPSLSSINDVSRSQSSPSAPIPSPSPSTGHSNTNENPRPVAGTTPLINFSEDELQVSRMRVEGREQDFGPVHSPENQELLPPDYAQATEPYPRPVRRK